jgi:hypothetical protein
MSGYTKQDMIPVRRGKIYCARFCGCNCTYAEFKRATAESTSLAKRLGPSWKPRVFENAGWRWAVETRDGILKVHHTDFGGVRTYSAFLGRRWSANSPSVDEAIYVVISNAQAELRFIEKLVTLAAALAPPRRAAKTKKVIPR